MAHTAARPASDTGKSPEQLFDERTKRIQDVVELRQPDRIPICHRYGYFLSDVLPCSHQEVYEARFMKAALEKACLMFQPDYYGMIVGTPGHSHILGDQTCKWPGYGLPATGSYQYDEREWMKADEYDAFIRDPGDWAVRFYTPRIFSELKGLAKLPHLGLLAMGHMGMVMVSGLMSDPDLVHACKKLVESAEFHHTWAAEQRAIREHMRSLGFPSNPFVGGQASAPFDFMSDTLRAMRGIFMDMFRRPEKLLAAEEAVCDFQIQHAVEHYRATGLKYIFIPLHRGSGGFMTMEQFDRFYWPQFKRLMLGLIDNGLVPYVFYEGVWDRPRLERVAELPKGKSIGYYQDGDFSEIKAIVGDTMCIQGGMPVSMLQLGSVAEVRERTKFLCDVVGKNGGYVMTTNIGDLEGCKPELINAWVDATHEFGTY
jgi:hypothetical protein